VFVDNSRHGISEEMMLLNKIVNHDLCFCFAWL